jgi:hypothetical protein
MMHRFRKSLWVAALAVILGTAASARADLTITVQEDGGAVQTIVNVKGNPTTDLFGAANATTADYQIKIDSGESNQTGTLAELLSSVLDIKKTGTGTGTLHIVIMGTGYSAPTTPPAIDLLSHIATTTAVGSAKSTFAFQSFVGATGFGSQSQNVSAAGSDSNDVHGLITSLAAPFSIRETIDLNLSQQNDQINYASSTTLTPVPAPAGLVLALTGLPVLGIGGWLRRRRKLA